MSENVELRVGPFTFRFWPDGDDPGTGELSLETDSGYHATTPLGLPREEFDRFVHYVEEAR